MRNPKKVGLVGYRQILNLQLAGQPRIASNKNFPEVRKLLFFRGV